MFIADFFRDACLAGFATLAVSFPIALSAQDATTLSPEVLQRGLLNIGDTSRLQQALAKARRGEKVVVGFIGGSITEGAAATAQPNRYAERVTAWWRKTFPKAQIEIVNAGIGASGSNFGALRIQKDVLSKHPDVLVVDYGVNDQNTEENARTFEGLVRQALKSPDHPAVVLLFMLHESGANAQEWFAKVGAHYDVPMVSYRDAIWPEIQSGKVKWKDISPDNIHPNDLGHSYTAQTVDALFSKVLETIPADDKIAAPKPIPAPLLTDLYENTSLMIGEDLKPVSNNGWVYETPSDAKCKGWKSSKPGSVLEFEIKGKTVFFRFWRINGAMGKVRVTVDGAPAGEHDAWFDQTWGGYNSMLIVAKDLKPELHRVRIELLEEKNPQSAGNEFRVTGIGSAGL